MVDVESAVGFHMHGRCVARQLFNDRRHLPTEDDIFDVDT